MLRSLPSRLRPSLLPCGLLAAGLATSLSGTALAQSSGDNFYRAYYLENEIGELEAALELYRDAAKSGRNSPEMRAEIERRIRACHEELATRDLASLVPEDTILYVELNDPSDQLASLLDQLGLLQGRDGAGSVAVSEHLLDGTLGMRGAALALTRVDPTGGIPGGVLILHPGDMQAVRGLIETALPAGGQPTGDIGGHPTFLVENMVHVTMGERLVVASTERGLIEDVFRRVAGDRDDSFAAHPDLQNAMESRGDNLMYFCLNAEPVMPLVQNLLGAVAQQDPQAAMAISLLDVQSLRTISGSVGVGDDGLAMDVGIELAEGHRNVAFNLMRMPHVSPDTFHMIPEGSAFFLATSLNQRGAGGAGVTDAQGRPIVTIMDIGREVFGNLADVAVFSLPSVTQGPHGMVIPDAALAMSVNDPERSKAIWELALGLAQGASGNGDVKAHTEKFGSTRVARFDMQGVGVYLFVDGNRIVVSPSVRAIEAATKAANGHSIAQDPMFASLVAEASSDHTSVLGVSLGRAAHMASQVMPERDLREIGPYLELLENSTLVATTRHSDTQLGWSARLTGLPNVGPVVERFVRAELGGLHGMQQRRSLVTSSQARPVPVPVASHYVQGSARTVAESKAAEATPKDLAKHFEALSKSGKLEAAAELIPAIADSMGDDAMALNDFAWNTLTADGGEALAAALLPVAQRSNELSDGRNWYVLDTLAHVHFALGHVEKAIEVEKRAVAIAKVKKDSRASEGEAALERFLKAKGASSHIELDPEEVLR